MLLNIIAILCFICSVIGIKHSNKIKDLKEQSSLVDNSLSLFWLGCFFLSIGILTKVG